MASPYLAGVGCGAESVVMVRWLIFWYLSGARFSPFRGQTQARPEGPALAPLLALDAPALAHRPLLRHVLHLLALVRRSGDRAGTPEKSSFRAWRGRREEQRRAKQSRAERGKAFSQKQQHCNWGPFPRQKTIILPS